MSVKREKEVYCLLGWAPGLPSELWLWEHLSILNATLKFKDAYSPCNMVSKHKPNPSPDTQLNRLPIIIQMVQFTGCWRDFKCSIAYMQLLCYLPALEKWHPILAYACLCTRHCSRCFVSINSFNPDKNYIRMLRPHLAGEEPKALNNLPEPPSS